MLKDDTTKTDADVSPSRVEPRTRTEGLCPKCQGATGCRREETESGPVWYCVNFDVKVSA